MTMVPTQTLSNQQQQQPLHHHHLFYGGGYGGCGGGSYNTESFGVMSRLEGYEYCISEADPMAEDESRTNSLNEAAASTSKDNNNKNIQQQEQEEEEDEEEERDRQGWLQLSIGGHSKEDHHDHQQLLDPTVRRSGGLIELDLLPGTSTCSSQQVIRPLSAPIFQVPSSRPVIVSNFTTSTSFYQQQQQAAASSSSMYPHHQHQEINWAFRHMPHINYIPTASVSASSQSLGMGSSSYFLHRPSFQVHSSTGLDIAGPSSSDFRLIDPPRRHHSGIWFTLQASKNQVQEPFLPQISKSYLRIKDGRMTVRLLMKYLVNKLRLDSESEVEITCRGQQLLPFLTLQHVRDNIWSTRDALTLLPDSSTTDHVMVLHYARTPQK